MQRRVSSCNSAETYTVTAESARTSSGWDIQRDCLQENCLPSLDTSLQEAGSNAFCWPRATDRKVCLYYPTVPQNCRLSGPRSISWHIPHINIRHISGENYDIIKYCLVTNLFKNLFLKKFKKNFLKKFLENFVSKNGTFDTNYRLIRNTRRHILLFSQHPKSRHNNVIFCQLLSTF